MCADAEQSGCDRAVSQWLAFTVSAAASGCDTASHTSLFSHKTINICSVITNELSVSEKMVIIIATLCDTMSLAHTDYRLAVRWLYRSCCALSVLSHSPSLAWCEIETTSIDSIDTWLT